MTDFTEAVIVLRTLSPQGWAGGSNKCPDSVCERPWWERDRRAVQIKLSRQVLLRERKWKCGREGKRPAPGDRRGRREERDRQREIQTEEEEGSRWSFTFLKGQCTACLVCRCDAGVTHSVGFPPGVEPDVPGF